MADKKDFYEVLGVSKNASADELKAAYRKSALQWHPDRHQGEDKKKSEEKFKEINEAYQVLSDAQKKATYDQFGHAAFEQGGMGSGGPFGGFGQQGGQQGPFTYTYYTGAGQQGEPASGWDFGGFSDPFEIFEQFFGNVSPFGGGGRRTHRRKTYSLSIDFDEAVHGVEKTVTIEGKNSTIKIPAGVDEGSRIRFGEFDIVLEVKNSDKYKREGDDLIIEEKINFATAIIGGVISVMTIDGPEKIKIHSGTQPGTVIRLKNKGVPHVRGDGRGDLYVRLNIKVPEKITNRQKELLKEFEGDKKSGGWF